MSAQYGLLPNLILQPSQPKPADPTPVLRVSAPTTKETAPTEVTKVAPSFEANSPDPARAATDNKHSENRLSPEQPLNLQAESKVAATDTLRAEPITPTDLAEQKAKDLALAREHALQYREYKARTERTSTDQNVDAKANASSSPKMDVRIPVLDEIPDRPLPRLGVPIV